MRKKVIQHFSNKELKEFSEDSQACVTLRSSEYNFALFPYHLSNLTSSVKEILNGNISKYDKKLGGILLGYNNLKIKSAEGSIVTDSCHIHVTITADFYIFQPEVGSILKGVVNKKAYRHIGCLVHRMFNVSIPREETEETVHWLGDDISISEEIVLRVSDIDLETRLPYIRAKLISTEKSQLSDPYEELRKKSKKHKKQKKQDEEVIVPEEEATSEKKRIKKSKKDKNRKINDEDVIQNNNTDESLPKKRKKNQSQSSEFSNENDNVEVEKIRNDRKKRSKHSKNDEFISSFKNTSENTPLDCEESGNMNEEDQTRKKKKKKKKDKHKDSLEISDTEKYLPNNISKQDIPAETKKKKNKHLDKEKFNTNSETLMVEKLNKYVCKSFNEEDLQMKETKKDRKKKDKLSKSSSEYELTSFSEVMIEKPKKNKKKDIEENLENNTVKIEIEDTTEEKPKKTKHKRKSKSNTQDSEERSKIEDILRKEVEERLFVNDTMLNTNDSQESLFKSYEDFIQEPEEPKTKKSKKKHNETLDINRTPTKHKSPKKEANFDEDDDSYLLRQSLINEQRAKLEDDTNNKSLKKKDSGRIVSNRLLIMPQVTMANEEDRKSRSRRLSAGQIMSVDSIDSQLLYDSELERILSKSPKSDEKEQKHSPERQEHRKKRKRSEEEPMNQSVCKPDHISNRKSKKKKKEIDD